MSLVTNRVVVRLTTNLNYRAAWVDHLGHEQVLPLAAGKETLGLAELAVQLWYPKLFGAGVEFDQTPRAAPDEKIIILQKTTNGNWRAYWMDPVSREPHILPLVAGIASLHRAVALVTGRYVTVLGIPEIVIIPDPDDPEWAQVREQGGIWFMPDHGAACRLPTVQTPATEELLSEGGCV
jgi:hypothetical protein